MFDLREHKGLIRRLVSEANKNDANWHWSLKALSKTKASIFWEYLEYCEQPKPYFEIKVYTDEDNDTLIWAMDANSDGEKLDAEIVQSGSIPSVNTPLDEAIRKMVHSITFAAHNCY